MIRADRRRDVPAGTGFRSGFACFVGRPNAGKSTLTNALVGSKIAIASDKPQTTRHAIRGIVHRADAQLVLIDTPGLHRPRTLLGERLNDLVRGTWTEVDVIGVCLPANQRIGPGDTYLVGEIAALRAPAGAGRGRHQVRSGVRRTGWLSTWWASPRWRSTCGVDWAHIVPVSATAGDQIDVLADTLVSLLPEGPPLYPDGEITDEPEETLVAELIREVALEGVRDELPHSITVTVEEMGLRAGRPGRPAAARHLRLLDRRTGLAEGHHHRPPRQPAAASSVPAARRQIENLLGTPVYLDLRVKVLKEWQRDPKHLNRLGFWLTIRRQVG